ncbi:leucyl/phenylalanyl-tRNA--protein transferase [Thioclava sp. 'Guangxiensis']|uniref:leucyl/phenylalanyl-tRNA--protein transferase n=1 Tax=Thioclava sp. 'Guangxiensis' TaxID=3149044 RepID=UPI0038783145
MAESLTAELLLAGYANGIFPMAESRDDPRLYWFEPKLRGVIPLEGFHLSRSLAREIRRMPYRIRVNYAFRATVEGCAARDETWINEALFSLYDQLHMHGFAHSMEVWDGDALVGGLFGVSLGGAFFGESMFSRRKNASKIAITYVVDRLKTCGFTLFDTQYLTPHLASLGGIEIPRAQYRAQLEQALEVKGDFARRPLPSAQELVQRMTQTS